MDELGLVREFFAEPAGPAPGLVDDVRNQLRRTQPRRGRPHLPRRVLAGTGVPVTVIGVAAAVFAAVVLQAPSSLPGTSAASRTPGLSVFRLQPGALGAVRNGTASGRAILLMAAEKIAGTAGQRTGRYWVSAAAGGNFVRVGPASDPYVVLEKISTRNWAAQNPGAWSGGTYQPVGVQLASPADQAAWRRDGSPYRWRDVGQATSFDNPQGGSDGEIFSQLSAAPGRQTGLWAANGLPPFLVGTQTLSLGRLRALPADPARLKALLMQGYESSLGSPAAYLLQAVPPVLQMPVTPAVRSALYALLAGMSGVRSLGLVRDVAGEQGNGVSATGHYSQCGFTIPFRLHSYPADFSSCTVQEILIIDPATGLPLAEELRYLKLPPGARWSAPGGLFSYEIFGASYWTNAGPPVK